MANGAARPLEPGLYFVATPIGAARDITLRALDILGAADVLAAEDTRTLRHLLTIHGIALNGRPLVAYHEHSGPEAVSRLLAALREGKSVACVSEAGTPLVADPGFELGRAARAEGLAVHAAPGASAVLAALTVSGLPSDRFMFAGFPPPQQTARRKWLAALAPVPATLILFESPRRIGELLADAAACLGEERQAAVCRELTKRFEEVTRGTLAELRDIHASRDPKGEIVLVVDRAPMATASPADLDTALRAAMRTMSVRDAAGQVAEALGLPRREVYQAALRLERGG